MRLNFTNVTEDQITYAVKTLAEVLRNEQAAIAED
jgi:DNA-binding transcriptional MocR family regulator